MLGDQDLIYFFRQLQYLLNSGISLYPSIKLIHSDNDNHKTKKVITDIVLSLREGDSFSKVLAEKVKVGVFITNIIRVGEHEGTLNDAVEKVIDYLERKQELKRKVMNAFSYPLLLTVVGLAILLWINIQIIPNFQEVYAQAEVQLPLPTRIMFFTHNFFMAYWFHLLVTIAASVLLVVIFFKEGLKMYIAKTLYVLPIAGKIYYYFSMLIFLSNFGTLHNSGISVIKAIKLSVDSVNNIFFKTSLTPIFNKILEGMKVSKALEETDFFPNMVIQMISTGEESAALGDVSLKVSEHLDQEMDMLISRLISLIGPVSLILIGIFVAFVSMSFLLPLFRMTAVIHG